MRSLKKVSNCSGGHLRPIRSRAGQGFVEYIIVLAVGVLVLITPFPSRTVPDACANKTQTAIGCLTDSIKGAYEGYNFAVTRPVYMDVNPAIGTTDACIRNPGGGACTDLAGQVAGYGQDMAEDFLDDLDDELLGLASSALSGVWSGFGTISSLADIF